MALSVFGIRFRLRTVALAAVLAGGLGLAGAPHFTAWADENAATFTLDQARDLAEKALRRGDLETARRLAMGLVQADPEDAHAYAVLAAVHANMNNPSLARSAARLSYKHSPNPTQSYHAAHTAGRIAYQQERFNAAQFWLRRAATHADNAQKVSRLGQDYARVKSANPFSFRLNLTASPSDNVNNGADSALYLVNGEEPPGIAPTIGTSSQALSGFVGTADLNLRYRLAQTAKTQTHLTARLYTRRVALSSAAKAAIDADPSANLTNADLANTSVELGIARSFALGKPGNYATFTGTTGRAWSAGKMHYDLARIEFSPSFALGDSTRLSLSARLEQRWSHSSPLNDQRVIQLRSTVSQKLASGDRLSFGLSLQDVASDARNGAYQTANLNVNYSFAKQVGPMRLSTGLTLGHTNYDEYAVLVPVLGGRQDLSLYGDVTMMFTDYDYAGFAPTVRIRAGRKSSNISRFNTREVSVTLGIQSKF